LVDDPTLKYRWLADFDRDLMQLASRKQLLDAAPARCLYIDHAKKILVAERANLIFVFNFSVSESPFAYPVHVSKADVHELVLDTDLNEIGGHGRLDPSINFLADEDGIMRVYSPSRSAQVYARRQGPFSESSAANAEAVIRE
jgi:1,4-alpha-glucan branching enzyme